MRMMLGVIVVVMGTLIITNIFLVVVPFKSVTMRTLIGLLTVSGMFRLFTFMAIAVPLKVYYNAGQPRCYYGVHGHINGSNPFYGFDSV